MATFGGIVVSTGGAVLSGRRIFLDVIDELARPVDASDTTIRAHAADAFRAAIRTIDRKGLWPWEIMDEDVSITANNKFSTVTGAVKKPLAMHFLDAAGGTRDQTISYISYDRFMEKYTMDVTGEPYLYTVPNFFETSQVRWHPTPSANDNARFTYYRSTPTPRNEQDPVEIPDMVIEMYMSVAWYEFLKRIPSEQRPFAISTARAEMNDSFREMSAHVASPGDRSRAIYGVR